MGALDDPARWEIEPNELQALLAEREATPFRLIDCREQEEFTLCHLGGSELMPLSEFAEHVAGIGSPDEPIVVYCHHGMRSLQATQYLRARGHAHTFSLRGGIDAWSSEIDGSVPRY